MQAVLRNVKEEIIHEQQEHEKLQQRLQTSEKKKEEAEAKILEAESKVAGLQAVSATPAPSATSDGQSTPGGNNGANAAVEAAVEKVARELHGLYKTKHETKVAALKKSYEARWEKKIKDLESRVTELDHENEELKVSKDATLSGVVPGLPSANNGHAAAHEDAKRRADEVRESEEQRTRIEVLAQEIEAFKCENTALQQQLETERLEMAELVKATEEMMQLSQQQPGNTSGQRDEKTTSGSENLRGSVSKASSWKQSSIGTGESWIGRMTGGGGSVGGTRSGIMSSIEKMGRGRAVD